MNRFESRPGTYCILFRSSKRRITRVGRWGYLHIEPGYYLYVGSAFGPGGVSARVLRHCRTGKAKHWHVDYLRDLVAPVRAWYSNDPKHLEHRWAQGLSKIPNMTPVNGFGCSDCRCQAHLFHSTDEPASTRVVGAFGGRVETLQFDEPAD